MTLQVPRRFRAFESLAAALQAANIAFPLPRKHVLRGRFRRSKTVETERRVALQSSLEGLLRVPAGLALGAVRAFFSIEEALAVARGSPERPGAEMGYSGNPKARPTSPSLCLTAPSHVKERLSQKPKHM